MPRLDGTGPLGFGPRTGRGFGSCCGGFRGYFSKKNQKAALEQEEQILKEELAAIQEEKAALQEDAK